MAVLANYGVRECRDAHRAVVTKLDWNCQGKRLATGSPDQVIRIWNVELAVPGKDKQETELALGREPNEVLWHPTHPDQLATSAADNLIKLWDVRTSKGAYTTKLKNKNGYMFMAFNHAQPDVLAAVSIDSEVSFLDVRGQKVLATLPQVKEVNEVAFSRSGRLFFRTLRNGSVEIFSYPGLVRLHTIFANTAPVHCLDITKNGQTMATGGADARVVLTELETLTCFKTYWVLDTTVTSVKFSHDDQYLAYHCLEDKEIHIDQWQKGEEVALINTPNLIHDMKWNPKHAVLAYTGSYFDRARVATSTFGNFSIYAPKAAA